MTVTEVTEQSFERDVVARSHEAPVVVDFWAAWCGPCRALSPVLERLADEANGAWTLAKVDVDQNPRLAQAFGIRGIPAVKAFVDGRAVGEFTGALPEPQVRQWLAGLGPGPADDAFAEGAEFEAASRLDDAAAAYRRALDLEPAHAQARSALARVELALRSAGRDEAELRARLDADGFDIDAIAGLAELEASTGRIDSALNRLLDAVRMTSGNERDAARVHLLRLMDALPADDARVAAARRALSRALF